MMIRQPKPGPGLYILITDDNQQFRATIRAILITYLGTQVKIHEAENGNAAVAKCEMKIKADNKNFDLIIMDYQMPPSTTDREIYRDGQAATTKIRAIENEYGLAEPERSVIFTWSMEKNIQFQGANDVIPKPCSPADVESALIRQKLLD